MDRIFSSRWTSPAAVLVIAVSVLAAYSNTFHVPFQYDDLPSIANNAQMQSLENFWSILRSNRGVTYLTFALNYALGGPDVFGYHLVNTAIHVLNSALVYFLLLSVFDLMGFALPRARFIAVSSALLFALHPVQTQSVTYIVQRMESLSATFFILALMAFARGAGIPGPARRWGCYALAGACYVLSFYSKETAITLPAVVLLFDFCFVSKGRALELIRKRWVFYALLGVLLGVFTAATIMPMGGFSDLSAESAEPAVPAPSIGTTGMSKLKVSEVTALSAGFSMKGTSPKEYLFTQFNVMAYYFTLVFVPVNQNLDYDFPVSRSLFETPEVKPGTALTIPLPPPVVSLIFLLFVAGLGVWFMASTQNSPGSAGRAVSFFIFWYFIILSPTSSVVPIADVIYEHRLYLPSLAFFTVFAICVEAMAARLSGGRGGPA